MEQGRKESNNLRPLIHYHCNLSDFNAAAKQILQM